MSKKHAVLSPSSAHRWSSCTASVNAAALNNEPDEGSDAARLGTCGHQILEDLLTCRDTDPQSYLGREYWFKGGKDGWPEDLDVAEPDYRVLVDQEMIDAVVTAHDFIVEQAELIGGTIVAEQRVPIGHITGEDEAHGTSDVVIEASDTLVVMDLKLGRRKVNAYEVITPAHEDIVTGETVAEVVRPNLQMVMYSLGVLHTSEREFRKVRLVIIQPFLRHVSEWSGSVEEVQAVGEWLSVKAEETRTRPVFAPSAENCVFCRASGSCDAQNQMIATAALDGFDEIETARVKQPNELTLGDAYALVPLVQVWAKAVEGRVRQNLSSGQPVIRSDGLSYKLVEGKMGARSWSDDDEAEAALKKMRLRDDVMYKRKLISPTDAEKLAKVKKPKKGEEPVSPVLGKTQWNKLQSLITQERGQPVVALQTDPRPALAAAAEGFDDVPPADNSDLF